MSLLMTWAKEEIERANAICNDLRIFDFEIEIMDAARLRGQIVYTGQFSARIRLAAALVADETGTRNTIRHEIAHALDRLRYGGRGHSATWQKCATELGCNAVRCGTDSVAVTALRPEAAAELACPMGCWSREYYRISKAVRNPANYRCPECRATIVRVK